MSVTELKLRFYELDEEHERLKVVHAGWRGVEPEPLQRVRLMKEKVAKEIWNEENL